MNSKFKHILIHKRLQKHLRTPSKIMNWSKIVEFWRIRKGGILCSLNFRSRKIWVFFIFRERNIEFLFQNVVQRLWTQLRSRFFQIYEKNLNLCVQLAISVHFFHRTGTHRFELICVGSIKQIGGWTHKSVFFSEIWKYHDRKRINGLGSTSKNSTRSFWTFFTKRIPKVRTKMRYKSWVLQSSVQLI